MYLGLGLGLGLGLVVAVRWWGAGRGLGRGRSPLPSEKNIDNSSARSPIWHYLALVFLRHI